MFFLGKPLYCCVVRPIPFELALSKESPNLSKLQDTGGLGTYETYPTLMHADLIRSFPSTLYPASGQGDLRTRGRRTGRGVELEGCVLGPRRVSGRSL